MHYENLAETETAAGRPFTSPRLIDDDRHLLGWLVDQVRDLVRGDIAPYRPIEWSDGGLKRRTIICDPPALLEGEDDLSLVGFFGERDTELDGTPLEEANAEIVLEFRHYPGILSYSSVELKNGNWANLVLHDRPETRDYWRASRRHARAAEQLSPLYYRTVRIHNGVRPGGLRGSGPIRIERTKYWDFGPSGVWRAVRELSPTVDAER